MMIIQGLINKNKLCETKKITKNPANVLKIEDISIFQLALNSR